MDTLVQTVATQLDEKISPRASQATVDALADTLNAVSNGVAALAAAIPNNGSIAALQAAVTNLSADVAAKSTQVSVDAAAFAATRIAIERALSDGIRVVWFMLPETAGGQLDLVRQIVRDSLAGMQTIGVRAPRAHNDFENGEQAYAAGDYRRAYEWYGSAYQRLQK
jgi:hypothetical protein